MLKIKTVTMKNFMSVGAVTQAVNLEENGLTLILGDNMDLGSNGSRNGVGKTVLLHAISFGLFGVPLTNIRKDNLINKTNGKNMMVTVEFEKNGHTYRIERGRRPNHFKYIVDSNVVNESDTDEAQGDSRDSKHEIEQVFGTSHMLFKHIAAMSTKTVPFLSEKSNVQRDLIEELLGITQLSQKADHLRELIRATKTEIDREEMRIKIIQEQNDKTKNTINEFTRKSTAWESNKQSNLEKLAAQTEKLMELNIDQEIQNHKLHDQWKTARRKVRDVSATRASENRLLDSLTSQVVKAQNTHDALINHQCSACGQEIHDDRHSEMLKKAQEDLEAICEKAISQQAVISDLDQKLSQAQTELDAIAEPNDTFYDSLEEAYEHKSNLDRYMQQMEKEINAENPYIEQIQMMQTQNLQEVNYDTINNLSKIREHQEFILKILTDKKSWVRMQIIDQNLGYLNHRLAIYLNKLGLPHNVKFQSDLSVQIEKLGQEFDFDNLSNGESIRLILSLSWAFRDVFETLNQPMNLMFIDELIDSGVDSTGVENTLGVLKNMTREQNKNIFLVSHREELISRVSNVLMATKENNFTNYSYESDVTV